MTPQLRTLYLIALTCMCSTGIAFADEKIRLSELGKGYIPEQGDVLHVTNESREWHSMARGGRRRNLSLSHRVEYAQHVVEAQPGAGPTVLRRDYSRFVATTDGEGEDLVTDEPVSVVMRRTPSGAWRIGGTEAVPTPIKEMLAPELARMSEEATWSGAVRMPLSPAGSDPVVTAGASWQSPLVYAHENLKELRLQAGDLDKSRSSITTEIRSVDLPRRKVVVKITYDLLCNFFRRSLPRVRNVAPVPYQAERLLVWDLARQPLPTEVQAMFHYTGEGQTLDGTQALFDVLHTSVTRIRLERKRASAAGSDD